MTTYILTYDLNKNKDYEQLWNELERLEAHRALRSFWLLNVDATAPDLRDHFSDFIDDDDFLWVSELTKHRNFTKAFKGTKQWLSENMPDR
jgi:CRISPR/Cas system-associated endoribonuclease Cas2